MYDRRCSGSSCPLGFNALFPPLRDSTKLPRKSEGCVRLSHDWFIFEHTRKSWFFRVFTSSLPWSRLLRKKMHLRLPSQKSKRVLNPRSRALTAPRYSSGCEPLRNSESPLRSQRHHQPQLQHSHLSRMNGALRSRSERRTSTDPCMVALQDGALKRHSFSTR